MAHSTPPHHSHVPIEEPAQGPANDPMHHTVEGVHDMGVADTTDAQGRNASRGQEAEGQRGEWSSWHTLSEGIP